METEEENDVSDDEYMPAIVRKRRPGRGKSRPFNRKETKLFIELIDEYKLYILNKSSSTSANRAKDAAWAKIALTLNDQKLGPARTVEHLKTRWDHVKTRAKKVSQNILKAKSDEHTLNTQIIQLMNEADCVGDIDMPAELMDMQIDSKYDNDKSRHSLQNRTPNFTPPECSILLKCVREEKQVIFSKECTTHALDLKDKAWAQITKKFNKLNSVKRTQKALREKFKCLKGIAKSAQSQCSFKGLIGNREMNEKEIKTEPAHDATAGSDIADNDVTEDYLTDNLPQTPEPENNHPLSDAGESYDPLCSVLNGDSGTGSFNMGSSNQPDNKEVIRLKTKLLKYQLETARIERERLKLKIAEEESAREATAVENALRLRTARLEAVAATQKLPPDHPALVFTDEEMAAKFYLSQFTRQ